MHLAADHCFATYHADFLQYDDQFRRGDMCCERGIRRAFRERRWGSNDGSTGEGQDEETDGRDLDGAGRYGMMDFRSFHRWRFAAHPFFRTEEKSKTSIGVRSSQLAVSFQLVAVA